MSSGGSLNAGRPRQRHGDAVAERPRTGRGRLPGRGPGPHGVSRAFRSDHQHVHPSRQHDDAAGDHTATLLPSGRVLLCGGYDASGAALRRTELLDPATGLFTPAPPMATPRAGQAAVLVGNRTVLIGGTVSGRALATTAVFDGTSWVAGPKLLIARVKHAAIALPDRRILIVGGASSVEGRRRFDSTELINMRSDDVSAGPSLSQGEYKLDGAIVELHDGRVVIAGGTHLDLFDPQTDTVSVLAQPVGPQLAFLSATAVAHRLVLIAGGYDRDIIPTSRAVLVTIPRRGG